MLQPIVKALTFKVFIHIRIKSCLKENNNGPIGGLWEMLDPGQLWEQRNSGIKKSATTISLALVKMVL